MRYKKEAILIILLISILIGITFIYIKGNKKEANKETTTKTTQVTTTTSDKIPLSNEDIINSVSIYSGENFEFSITNETDSYVTVERKNLTTNRVDMIFKVDKYSGLHEIEKTAPPTQSAGGGGV